MKILVIGRKGQCAQEINSISEDYAVDIYFVGSEECDVRDLRAVRKTILERTYDGIINCAAYTAVDDAEDNEKLAFAINLDGIRNIDQVCRENNIKYIHISTDYVFDGTKTTPYKESDTTNPIGVYGRSKLAGEEVVINSDADCIVIRTAWLYSSFGHNFMKTMLRLSETRDEINVVTDQLGTPTYAHDLAHVCVHILNNFEHISSNGKLYHFANSGIASWFEFASEIFSLKGINCRVKPIPAKEYPTKATRPKYSVLDCSKITEDYGIKLRDWKIALQECLKLT